MYLFVRLRSTGESTTATGGIGDGVRSVVLVLIGGTTVAVVRAAALANLPADADRTGGGGSTMFRPN